MSEPCSVCGTDLKKPYKHTRGKICEFYGMERL